ncbi:hypothetical protein MD484_g7076, partial [Candolleomyces efflorescens]
MNSFYDGEAARLALDAFMTEAVQRKEENIPFAMLESDGADVTFVLQPESYRLTENIDGVKEEITVRIPGIICSKTLPPVERRLTATTKNQIRNLRQYVKITGLGSLQFADLEEKVELVYQRFLGAIKEGVQHPGFTPHEGDSAIHLHSRYFTERRFAPNLCHTPFSKDVDPLHILEDLRGADYIHAADNDVQYLKKIQDGQNAPRYETLTPSEFKEGDIVEAGVSFVAYPQGKGHPFKLVFTLRSLALISSEHRMMSISQRNANGGPQREAKNGNGKRMGEEEGILVVKRKYITTTPDEEQAHLGL